MGGFVSTLANGVRMERNPYDDRWFGGGLSIAGRRVTADTVAQAAAVFPVVGLIGESVGSVPLEFKRKDANKDGAPFELAETIADQPNPLMSGPEFWSTMAFNTVLRGRAYAEPVVISPREIEIWPLVPFRLQERHKERTFGVDYWYEDGQTRHFRAGELFAATGISTDGIYAVVPWKVAETAIELANILDAFGSQFFKNGARPSGVLSTDQKLSPEAITRLKEEFNGNFAGVLNAGKVPVLEQALKYEAITSSNSDNQYLDIRRNTTRNLAGQWHVPLSLVGEGDKGITDQDLEYFVKYCLRPLCRRMEKAAARDLMTAEQRTEWAPQFNLDALLRGDSATQFRNAVLARTASTHSANDIRVGWFGLTRIDEAWADDPQTPLNSNRAADTVMGGTTAPQDRSDV